VNPPRIGRRSREDQRVFRQGRAEFDSSARLLTGKETTSAARCRMAIEVPDGTAARLIS
jgi:hypothetical protein